jgi:cysteine dioxygenase
MTTHKVRTIIDGLRSIPDDDFTCDHVYDFLAATPVDVDSISGYFHWSPSFYTRNLIYKDDRFEMMAICWEKGQVSRIHNHSEQRCWMTVPVGKLQGQNFAIAEIDESSGHCSSSKLTNLNCRIALQPRWNWKNLSTRY